MARRTGRATSNSLRNCRAGRRRSPSNRISPQGSMPAGPSTRAGGHPESSNSSDVHPAGSESDVRHRAPVGTTSDSPDSNSTTSLPVRPAGLGVSPLLRTQAAMTFRPGCRWPFTSITPGTLKFCPAPACRPLTAQANSLSPASSNCARRMGRSGSSKRQRKVRRTAGTALKSPSAACQIQSAPSNRGVTWSSSFPIHRPCQSVGRSKPMLQEAVSLQRDTFPASSQMRTLQ